ncbi:LytTR family transcriptional regulator [Rhodocytophaga rosea]|uniref:LytTR family transcriptional regulator n=1 Tax=Rhodocytophaga rosea TaxID=2704465 RepID=A0A6C0GPB1_9BACT|nr:LytTR family DNA-binding domain-containing protein [Rhodocytophaga rosea]QHT69878.1 LytTR family transcriptional regulator [Rhodocytophaga rosea]
MTQDFLRANLYHTGYYFSESFMFSSFWWIFVPLLIAQYYAVKYTHAKPSVLLIVVIVLPLITHIFAFPLLVWVLSSIFYYHTFAIQQTLTYTLSEHSYLLVFFYSIPVWMCLFLSKTVQPADKIPLSEPTNAANSFIETILVSEGSKKCCIAVADILYFSANPPYINIHLQEKKYLQNETLKSIATQLNSGQFIRIHKSTIVNIKLVASYTSRLNGDYDLTMKNGDTLRVSRNFAASFKQKFQKSHQLTAK